MTGLTELVANNDNVTLKEFALRCARQFGALIDMREEALDAPISDKLSPSDYYKSAFVKAKEAYCDFLANPPKYEEAEKKYNEYVEKETKRIKEENDERKKIKKRYEAMLAKVIAWQPPTTEHEELKKTHVETTCG